ncbi:MAG: NADPH-dependent F420 reductase [Acidimicrobiales bacterium]
MHVGVIGGTGPAGRSLAARLASTGVEVTIGSRAPERAAEVAGGLRERWAGSHDLSGLGAGSNQAAAGADLVVVATPWDSAPGTAAALADRLAGKVVVSMANALTKVGSELQALVPPRGSVAAAVQAAAPGALVAGALHHVPARELGDLDHRVESDVLCCSDHPAATSAVMDLLAGVPGLRPLDAGSLSNASAIEAFTAVVLNLNMRYRTRAGVRLTGVEPAPRAPVPGS